MIASRVSRVGMSATLQMSAAAKRLRADGIDIVDLSVAFFTTVHDVTSELDSHNNIDVIFLGFLKAFDEVPQSCLIRKLSDHGIHGKVLAWIKPWLKKRQRVSR